MTRLLSNTSNMKYFLPTVSLLFSTVLFAQKKFSEATLSYDIVINTDAQKSKSAAAFNGATSTVFIKGNKSRTEMVSSFGTQATLIDGSKNSISIIKEFGDQKYIIQLTPSNWKEANKKYEDVSFTYLNDSKEILGYHCKKAIGKLSDGSTYTVWYTTELEAENKDFQYANRSLPGLAMEYESSVGDLKVIYTVSKISFNPVPAAKLDLPRSGYRIMTYEESKG